MCKKIAKTLLSIAVMLFLFAPTLRVSADSIDDYAQSIKTSVPYAVSYNGANSYIYYNNYLAAGTTSGSGFTRRFNMRLSDGSYIRAVCVEAIKPSRAVSGGDKFGTYYLNNNRAYYINGTTPSLTDLQGALIRSGHTNFSSDKLYNMARVLYAAGLDPYSVYSQMHIYDTAPFTAWRTGGNSVWRNSDDYNRLVGHIAGALAFNSGDHFGLNNEGVYRYGSYMINAAHYNVNCNSYVINASSSLSVSTESVGLDLAYTQAQLDAHFYSEPFSYVGTGIIPDDPGVEIVSTAEGFRFKVPLALLGDNTSYMTSASVSGVASGGSGDVVLNLLHVCIPPTNRDQILMGVSTYTKHIESKAGIIFAFSFDTNTPPGTPPAAPPSWGFSLSKIDAATGGYISSGSATVGFYSDAACTIPFEVTYEGSSVSTVTLPRDGEATFTVEDGTIQVVYIKELSAPSGYALSSDVFKARPSMSIQIKNEVPFGEVTLVKKDADTGNSITGNDYTLNGAKYRLIADTAISYPGKGTVFTAGQVVGTFEVGKSYSLNPTTGEVKSSENGTAGQLTITGLLVGTYHFEETVAPRGFNVDESHITFTIGASSSELIKEVTSNESEVRAPFKFTKLSVELNSTVTHPYPGKEFKLYRAEDVAEYLGLDYDSAVVGGGIDWRAQDLRSIDWTSDTLSAMKLIKNTGNTKQLVVSATSAGRLKTAAGGIFSNGSYGDYVMTSEADGTVMSLPLPYGAYIVRETNCAEDYTEMRPFVVLVDEDSVTDSNILPDMDYGNKKNYPFGGRIHINKVDALTGRNIYVEGVGFQIFKSEDNGATYNATPLTVNGDNIFYTDANGVCYFGGTDYDLGFGYYMIKEVKSTSPDGYIYDDGYYISVKIANESTIEYHYALDLSEYPGKAAMRKFAPVVPTGTTLSYTTVYDDDDKPTNTFTIKYDNIPDKGSIKITKNGEGALLSWTYDGGFVYNTQLFSGARYAIYAAEDIYTYDHYTVGGSRTTYYNEGDLVSYILQSETDTEPEDYIETGFNYELWYYNSDNDGQQNPCFHVTAGDLGVVEISGLPLGQYVIKEVLAPEGHTLNSAEYTVTLSQGDKDVSTINRVSKTYVNERQQIDLKIKKLVFSTVEKPIAGRKFDLFAAEDIENYGGTVIVPAGTLIGVGESDANGYVSFSHGDTLPFAKYYVVEELVSDKSPDAQLTDPMEYEKSADWLTVASGSIPVLTYSYNGVPTVVGSGSENESVLLAEIDWNPDNQLEDTALYETKLWNVVSALTVLKTDAYTNKPVAGARMTLTGPLGFVSDAAEAESLGFADASVSVVSGKTVITFTSTIDGALISSPASGTYTLKEISAPTGYYLADKAWFSSNSNFAGTTTDTSTTREVTFDVTSSTDGYYTVVMYDVPKTGRIEISKLGEMFSGMSGTRFLYTDGYLQNAEYTVTAAEDIYAPDGSGQLLYAMGDEVAVIRTGNGTDITWDDSGARITPYGHGKEIRYEYDPNGDYVIAGYDAYGMPTGYTLVAPGTGEFKQIVTLGHIDTYKQWVEMIQVDPTDPKNTSNPANCVGLTGAAMSISTEGDVVGGTRVVLGDAYVYAQFIADNPDYETSGEINNWRTYGTAYLSGLPFGKYNVVESKAPAGYVLDATTNSAVITLTETDNTASRSFRNRRLRFELDVNKYNYSSSWNSAGQRVNLPVSGVRFGLFTAQNFTDPEGNVYFSEGDMLAEATSDANGHVAFNITDLPGGDYYLVDFGSFEYIDTEAYLHNSAGGVVNTGANGTFITDVTSEGHECGSAVVSHGGSNIAMTYPVFKITLDSDGVSSDVSTVTRKADIFNKYYTIEVEKHGYAEWWAYLSGDATDAPLLSGARLEISNSAGTWSETWVTGSSPKVLVLPSAGDYVITELSAPAGYRRIDPYLFTVTTDDWEMGLYLNILDSVSSPFISKRDIVTGDELPGASMHIEDTDGVVLLSWVSTNIPYEFTLPDGHYVLVEDVAPLGYNIATSIPFQVSGGKIVSHEDNKVIMNDKPSTGLVEISKVDITNDKELPGARLELRNDSGDLIDSWVSTEESHYVKITVSGDYTLTEITAPNGYYKAESITFTVDATSGEVTKVVMKDKPISYISKVDITNDKELAGAELKVTDAEGNVVDHWTSTTTPHIFGILKPDNTYDYNIPDGKYTLIEDTAPLGYYKTSSIIFDVKNGAIVGGKVTMKDTPAGYVEISKVDITNNNELPGAKLIITDKDGKTVESWTSGTKPHYVKITKSGEYTLTEVTAPNGYAVAESITFTIDVNDESKTTKSVVMKDKPFPKVIVKKLDFETGKYVAGAKLQITDSNGNVVETWTTNNDVHNFYPKTEGTYTLSEVYVPVGYLKAEPVTFTVSFSGDSEVIMYDKPITDAGIIRLSRTSKRSPYIVPRTDSTGEAGSSIKIEQFDGKAPTSPKTVAGIIMIAVALIGLAIFFILNRQYIKSYPGPIIGIMAGAAVIALIICIVSNRSNNVSNSSVSTTASTVTFDRSELEENVSATVADVKEEYVDDKNYLYVDYNFTSYDPNAGYTVPNVVAMDGVEYVYTGEIEYETESVTPVAIYVAQKALLVDESMDSSYSLPLISGSSLDLPLYRTSTSDTAIVDYTVTKTVEFEDGVTSEDIPNKDTITYYNEILGIDMTIDATRIGDIEYLTKYYDNGEIYAIFEASDANRVNLFFVEDYKGDPVTASEVADAPYFENYAAIITELLGSGVEGFAVTGGEWTGDVFEEDGVFKREAVFHYTGYANVIRAMYEGTGEAYGYNAAAMYMAKVPEDQTSDVPRENLRALYGMKATAKYVEKK